MIVFQLTTFSVVETARELPRCVENVFMLMISILIQDTILENIRKASDVDMHLIVLDASNAFNSLNRLTALHNITRLCPSLATVLINTYRAPTELFVDGDVLYSREGTTQGDPLAMPMYALAIMPLVRKLQSRSGDVTQIWYADDAAATGKLIGLHEWWTHLTNLGPKFGYFVNPTKTWLITKEDQLATAEHVFANTGCK